MHQIVDLASSLCLTNLMKFTAQTTEGVESEILKCYHGTPVVLSGSWILSETLIQMDMFRLNFLVRFALQKSTIGNENARNCSDFEEILLALTGTVV